METKAGLGTQGAGETVRGKGVQRGCGCGPKQEGQQGSPPVAVSGVSSDSAVVSLTEREQLLYQAGQCFGAAAALRQAAEAVNGISQRMAQQAQQQAEAGHRLLDQALGKDQPSSSGRAGAELGRRVVKAVRALLGDSG